MKQLGKILILAPLDKEQIILNWRIFFFFLGMLKQLPQPYGIEVQSPFNHFLWE